MDIKELLNPAVMILDLAATDKMSAIDEMVDQLFESGVINDREVYRADILKREQETSTGIGDGIAMPHAKNAAVQQATVLFARSQAGVDYQSLDGQPVHLFFMIAVPAQANEMHLQTLAALSSLLLDKQLLTDLQTVTSPAAVQQAFEQAQARQTAPTKAVPVAADAPLVLAVTACPTGIAHTYMAESALLKAGASLQIPIKVETNGSEGVKHQLSAADIKRAAGIIIAADKKVEVARFAGKPVLQVPVVDGIKRPEALIKQAAAGDAPIFDDSGNTTAATATDEKQGIWHHVYQDLMSGISNMLPFVVGGGILMALSFMLEQALGKSSLAFTFLNSLGTNAFSFLIPILAGFIAYSIGDRPALMPGFVGGYMATQASASIVKSTGSAGFIGGIIAGFLAGYVIVWLKHVFRKLPQSLDGLKPMIIFPILGLFLVGVAMYFVIDPIFSIVNLFLIKLLTNMGTANAVLLGAILGGMQAVDLGGPVNKAAYTTAIGVLTETGNGSMMAAVMVGGMVPPLAIALATTIWKHKFTADERKAGVSNYVLGISFITEGAIPFAIADPMRVITSCVIGSVLAGGLTQWWQVRVPAPHGGLWVVLLMQHPLYFVAALVIGALVAGTIYGLWRPQRDQQSAE
ncbi:PTS fructose transporter subunit IIABC [Lactiplantibacillus fabifermentans]|uniref:Fructose-specific phosphotransferase system, enzyme IIABC n=2 Tax=Lactiplantibacillus fabifermentans TaxID=483011 RepID=A0A0R2NPS3_9LACO|nr:fructose-specific PTS transporter subunit EIIC [Lactiplantibacillus fabifermentans]ETY73266.1 PTS fructose transporter subunit IIC [Lactiplantibacillus fabifermentans T30PCM01]KRO26866.1 fructose-specific phosphotransferase system, enzyme IIABC [Lactiplantibacillus fabifermentans DSM 21115]